MVNHSIFLQSRFFSEQLSPRLRFYLNNFDQKHETPLFPTPRVSKSRHSAISSANFNKSQRHCANRRRARDSLLDHLPSRVCLRPTHFVLGPAALSAHSSITLFSRSYRPSPASLCRATRIRSPPDAGPRSDGADIIRTLSPILLGASSPPH